MTETSWTPLAPAIVRHASLMKLSLPRWYGMRRMTRAGLGWYRVSEQLAERLANPQAPADMPMILPRWHECQRSGEPVFSEMAFADEESVFGIRRLSAPAGKKHR